MKRLDRARRVLIVRCLSEGAGVNAIARMAGVSKNTVLKLLADLGSACRGYHARLLADAGCGRLHVHDVTIAETRLWVARCPGCGMAVSWFVDPRDPLAA